MSEINALSQDIRRQEAGNANVAEWYEATIDSIPKSALKLLSIFTGFEKEEVVDHLNAMRSKAWFTASYPDMDSLFFLRFNMSQHPLYEYILARLIKDKNSRLIDVGCGLGQDVLKFVYDGASGSNIDTMDIDESVAKAGVDLFRCRLTNEEGDEEDKDTDTQHYIGDVFDLPPGHNSYNFVHAGALFHLFDRARQVELGIRLVSLLKDNQENLIFGHQLACVESGPVFVGPNEEEAFYHNQESFQQLWEEIGEKTGVRWRVVSQMEGIHEKNDFIKIEAMRRPEERMMRFSVHRQPTAGGGRLRDQRHTKVQNITGREAWLHCRSRSI